MAWFLGQSLLIIIAAILLGLLVGWLLWGRLTLRLRTELAERDAQLTRLRTEPAEAEPAEAEPEVEVVPESAAATPAPPEPAAEAETVPEPVAVAVEERDDDLERIEGIGPKMAGALRQAGIRTYTDLAGADEATLRTAIEAARLRFAPSLTTWSRQARLLADGDEDGFADLVRRLVAGRDVGRS